MAFTFVIGGSGKVGGGVKAQTVNLIRLIHAEVIDANPECPWQISVAGHCFAEQWIGLSKNRQNKD
jgi:hypothetical protein